MKRRTIHAPRATEKDLADGLVRAALSGKSETCQLCGAKVLSVALHYLSCPKVTGEKPKKGRTKNPLPAGNEESTAGPVEKGDPKPPSE